MRVNELIFVENTGRACHVSTMKVRVNRVLQYPAMLPGHNGVAITNNFYGRVCITSNDVRTEYKCSQRQHVLLEQVHWDPESLNHSPTFWPLTPILLHAAEGTQPTSEDAEDMTCVCQ